MDKTIVTGGAGFIASHLIDNLLARGEEVLAFDTNKELPLNLHHQKENKKLNYVCGDITDAKFLESIVTDDVKTIYHLASVVGVKNYCANPLKVIDINVIGTKKLIEAALKNNTKILFTSTSEVYGKNPMVPWKEDSDRVLGDPSIDRWVYSTTKSLCEHMLNAVHKTYGLPIVIVRYFNIYGPRQAPYFVIPANIHRVLNNKSPVVYDGGGQTRCFTFIDDAINGAIKATNSKAAVGNTFNIGNSSENTVLEAVNMILESTGKAGKLKVKFIDTQKLYGHSYEDLKRRAPNTEKAKRILGWKAEVPIQEGIRKTVAWAAKNDQWLRMSLPKEIG